MEIYGMYKGAKRLYDGYQTRKRARRNSQYSNVALRGYGNAYGRTNKRYQRRARRALRGANWRWGGFLGIERKYYDSAVANAAVASNANWIGCQLDPTAIPIANVFCLNAPTQGNGPTNRVGLRYNIVELHVSGNVQWPAEQNQNVSDNACMVYFALVLDKQTNGAQAATELIYQSPAATAAVAATGPLRNLQYSKRFKVLKTWQCVLTPTVLSYDGAANSMDQGGNAYAFDYFKQFKKPLVVETIANTGTVADVMNYSFHLIGVSSNTSIVMSYNSRVRFTDP